MPKLVWQSFVQLWSGMSARLLSYNTVPSHLMLLNAAVPRLYISECMTVPTSRQEEMFSIEARLGVTYGLRYDASTGLRAITEIWQSKTAHLWLMPLHRTPIVNKYDEEPEMPNWWWQRKEIKEMSTVRTMLYCWQWMTRKTGLTQKATYAWGDVENTEPTNSEACRTWLMRSDSIIWQRH